MSQSSESEWAGEFHLALRGVQDKQAHVEKIGHLVVDDIDRIINRHNASNRSGQFVEFVRGNTVAFVAGAGGAVGGTVGLAAGTVTIALAGPALLSALVAFGAGWAIQKIGNRIAAADLPKIRAQVPAVLADISQMMRNLRDFVRKEIDLWHSEFAPGQDADFDRLANELLKRRPAASTIREAGNKEIEKAQRRIGQLDAALPR